MNFLSVFLGFIGTLLGLVSLLELSYSLMLTSILKADLLASPGGGIF